MTSVLADPSITKREGRLSHEEEDGVELVQLLWRMMRTAGTELQLTRLEATAVQKRPVD